MVTVYHNKNFLDYMILFDDELAKEKANHLTPQELVPVAEVETDSLEEAYRLTNHLDKSWYENHGVKTLLKSRSTSVGDVLHINGKQFLVAMCGFIEI
jgi:hypothetical protein